LILFRHCERAAWRAWQSILTSQTYSPMDCFAKAARNDG